MRPTALWTAVLALAVALCAAAPARATISTAQNLDGPSGDIVAVDGVAMSEDGTGGLVYRKRVGGRVHIYVAQLANGRWRGAQRVDQGQSFDSSWPAIGAGDGGRLVVVWVQEFGVGTDRLFSASLDPGAQRFQPPVAVDLNVGEATGTYPSLAMNPSGTAYLAYRVPTEAGSNQNIIPGYLDMDTRVARYNGSLWSVLGSPADRNQSLPVRAPTAENSPKVGVSVDGNGLVAFQEPDEEFVDRVWARRVFNTTYGIPLLVSPKEYGGLPLRGPADAFDLDVSGFGEGAISFRQQPAQGSALSGPRVFTSTIPEAFSDNAGQFTAARTVDSGGATPGAPSVGVTPDGVFRTVWSNGATAWIANGSDTGVDPPAPVGDGKGAVDSTPLVDVARNEASVIAWRARSGVVAADEIRQNGSFAVKGVSDPSSGVISDLRLSGSGIGDGLVGFRQGDQGQTRVEAAIVDSPPLDFAVQVPLRFIHSKRPLITWDPAENALSRVRYTVKVRGKVLGRNISGTALRLNGKKLRDGRSKVEVIATDGAGQRRSGTAATLRLDRGDPRLRVSRHGRMVKVRVYDRVAGLRRSSVKVSFGDGKRARGKARVRHRYKRGGYVRLIVKATDKAGNRVTLKRRVRL